MNGYKTSGSWVDVTSMGRNEVVFEGRNKAYGAFYVRQRYPNALLIAFLSALTFLALCSAAPYLFRSHAHPVMALDPTVVIKLNDQEIHRKIITLPPPPPRAQIQPPKFSMHRFMPPIITRQIDSTPINRPDHTLVASTGIPGTGPETSIPTLPINDGGGGISVNKDEPIMWVPEMPKFPGNIQDYLTKQIQYPSEEASLGVQGIVYMTFVIERDGSVTNVSVKQGISNGPHLNTEAIRVISEMPKWSPGKQNGHPVRIQYTIPIHFKLQ